MKNHWPTSSSQRMCELNVGAELNDIQFEINLNFNLKYVWNWSIQNENYIFKTLSSCINFNSFQDECFRGCKKASSLKFVTYVPKWWNIAQLYLTYESSNKHIKHVTNSLISSDLFWAFKGCSNKHGSYFDDVSKIA